MLKELSASLKQSIDIDSKAQRTRNMSANIEGKADVKEDKEPRFKIKLCLSGTD